ncbi:MAG: TM1812 family CRISPR-associated protein, partial [Micromonosporaceae bacterium]
MSIPDREHILLTVLGLNPKRATYVLAGKEAEATLAPAALYSLLPEPDRPHRIVVLCTDKAEQATLPVLRETLGDTCAVEPVRVRADHTEGAVDAYLATLAKSVPDRSDLTVDVTHGLRHMSFLTYVGVLYLTSLRQVRLRGAYYGMLREPPQTSPFLDLRPLVKLPQWFHAVRVLKDTGSAHAIAELVSESAEGSASRVGPMLRSLSEAYGWGLPLELGFLARQFLAEQVGPLRDVLHAQGLPLADELVNGLTEGWAGQQIQQELPDREWKSRVRLDRTELERQA